MSRQDLDLRPLLTSDLAGVLAIQQASPGAAQWSEAQYQTALLDDDRNGGFVVEHDKRLVGFLLFRSNGPGETEVLNLAVHPDARRRGIATALVGALRRHVVGDIFLEVRSANRAAYALYEHSGFVPVGRRANYYRNPVDDALVMRL